MTPNPVPLANGQPATTTLTYNCPAPSSSLTTSFLPLVGTWSSPAPPGLWSASAVAACLALFLLFLPNRARWRRLAIGSGVASAILFALGCGGGSSGGGGAGGGGGGPTPTSITLTANSAKVPYGSNGLVLTAKVTGSHPLTGTVSFLDLTYGGGPGTVSPVNGTASVQFSTSWGAHAFGASYSGDSTNLPSQTVGSVTVVFTGTYSTQVFANTGNVYKTIPINLVIQ